jgi:hypothetical protein
MHNAPSLVVVTSSKSTCFLSPHRNEDMNATSSSFTPRFSQPFSIADLEELDTALISQGALDLLL